MSTDAALHLLHALVTRALKVSRMLKDARADGRESLNDAELEELLREDDQARAELQAAIDAARAEGR